MIFSYLFEIRDIQPFLFATGKLKDMIKGSEMIDFLCHEPLELALEACGLKGRSGPQFSPRCAGSSFYLIFDDAEDVEKVVAFRNVWTIFVARLLPVVEQVDAIGRGANVREAIANGLQQLKVARNIPRAELPAASPLTVRSPRTGKASVDKEHGESLDEATWFKRQFIRPAKSNPLTSRFSQLKNINWPTNFETDSPSDQRFPLAEGDRVALIHADGNGLGEVLLLVNEAGKQQNDADFIKLYRTFSDGLDNATISACKLATDNVLVPQISEDRVIPARPLVLGGDDLTLIVRADLALAYTEAFIKAFECQSQIFLGQLKEYLPADIAQQLPVKLTACAGITFMKPSQPFAQCYALTKSLCDRAKKQSRLIKDQEKLPVIPSSLAFHRIQGSLIEDAEQLFEKELLVKHPEQPLALGLPAYGVGVPYSGLPSLFELHQLSLCFQSGLLNDKRLRALATLLHLDRAGAEQEYQRWKALADKQSDTKSAFAVFEKQLQKLLGNVSEVLPANLETNSSVLADLLTYLNLVQPWKTTVKEGALND